MASPCLLEQGDLPVSTILKLLSTDRNDGSVCSLPPVKPKASEVYLFSPRVVSAKGTVYSIIMINILLLYD